MIQFFKNAFSPFFARLADSRSASRRAATPILLGDMLSTDVVPEKQSEVENDDYTVKDELYAARTFTDATEKSSVLLKVEEQSKKDYLVGTMTNFVDPSAYQTELSAFVRTAASRDPRQGDQVSVSELKRVYHFGNDSTWRVHVSSSESVSKQSEIINDDYTVKDENYNSRVFTNRTDKEAVLNKISSNCTRNFWVGSMANFTDPSSYQDELSEFVRTHTSELRNPAQGDQVTVTGLSRIYQYGSDGQWSIHAATYVPTKQSELTNDDHTVKDENYESRVFADLAEKTAKLTQVEDNKDDIVDLKAKDVDLQSQITLLQKKSYWVGSMANFVDPSAYQAELSAYVQTKMSRSAQEGDQVSVLDISKIYQYNGTEWVVYSESLALDVASSTTLGIVKIGDGIDVDANGVISIDGTYDSLKMKILETVTLETWVDDATNVPVGECVTIYAASATDGISTGAVYRICKKDADTVVIDAYEIETGKYYHKIKKSGTWQAIQELVGGASWGCVTGTLDDQTDLKSAIEDRVLKTSIVDDLTSTEDDKVLSANQGRVLAGKLTDGSVTKVGTDTVGGVLQPVYLDAGTPTAGTQLYEKSMTVNGTAYKLIGSETGAGPTIYAPTAKGSSGQYLVSNGDNTPTWKTMDAYAGGTAVTLNGTSKAKSTASFYAPTASGTAGQYCRSGGVNASPTWYTVPTYGGGTLVTLNGTAKAGQIADISVPTTSGTSGQYLCGYNGKATWNDYCKLLWSGKVTRGVTINYLSEQYSNFAAIICVGYNENNEYFTYEIPSFLSNYYDDLVLLNNSTSTTNRWMIIYFDPDAATGGQPYYCVENCKNLTLTAIYGAFRYKT